ncbi:MAG: hypothetical protein F6K30_23275 [Cyanothece sp. SIO2G6]|nr:hypothetical protein [Cyanothece sp. SIO2G6]
MIQNKDPLQSAGRKGGGQIYTDRDYSQFIKRPPIKSLVLAVLILFYIGIVMCIWMIGLKYLAIALAIITISIVLVGAFIAKNLA